MTRKAKFHLLLSGVVVFAQFVAYSIDHSQWFLCGVFLVAMIFCTSCIESFVYKLLKEASHAQD